MKVYLLDVGEGSDYLFQEETPSPAAAGHEVETKGPARWFARKLENLENRLRGSETGIGPHIHRLWEWLKRRAQADEPFLRRLRSAASLEIDYPPSVGEPAARQSWAGYLSRNRARHLFWTTINLLICPFTLLLVPLPGPNVIGFWFLYRAIAHLLALLGVQRALGRRIETSFHASAGLDREPGETFSAWIIRMGALHGVKPPAGLSASRRANQEEPAAPVASAGWTPPIGSCGSGMKQAGADGTPAENVRKDSWSGEVGG